MFGFLRNVDDQPSQQSLVTVFRVYMIICASIYFIGAALELTIDFKSTSLFVFVFLTIIPLALLGLSHLGVSHKLLLMVNMFFLFAVNEAQIIANPKAFHVLVYWIGLMPLIVTVLMQRVMDTILWTVVLIAFILANGLWVSSSVGPYTITIYPERFVAAGFLFALLTCSVAAFFSYIQIQVRRQLVEQNKTLSSLKGQLEQQRDQLNVKKNRLESYIKSIVDLSQSKEVINGEFDQAVERICKTLDYNMNVAQVSFWTYEEDQNTITSQFAFPENGRDKVVHDLDKFPRYAARLKEKRIIAAANALEDPSTAEFGDDYLRKQNIRAMLDAPLVINGQLVGIICCEDIRERNWDAEDLLFVSAACDILTISLKAMQHKQYIQEIELKNNELSNQAEEIRMINEQLVAVNEHLEDRVHARTQELEQQNQQLSEYAFINGHLLRAPLSSILGLINLLHASDLTNRERELVRHLFESGKKLDTIIQRISETLDKKEQFDRYDLLTRKRFQELPEPRKKAM